MYALEDANTEIAHWRKIVFFVPYGNAGKSFVSELSRLFHEFAHGSALETVALKAVGIISILLLQKPFRASKPKDHSTCLERRMFSWIAGDIKGLLSESQSIQKNNHMLPILPSPMDLCINSISCAEPLQI